jgi:hypothetical protein
MFEIKKLSRGQVEKKQKRKKDFNLLDIPRFEPCTSRVHGTILYILLVINSKCKATCIVYC